MALILRLPSAALMILLMLPWTAQAADRVVMGTGIDPSYGQAYIAAETGIFKKHGLDVEVKLFSSGSASTAALIPGDIQVSMTSVPAGALHHAIAPKVVLVGLTDILTGYNGCAAQANIKQLSDLRGRKVGIAKGTTSELSASQALQRVGMAMTDITPVYVEPPEMLAALLRKDIDAFFVWEPWITRAKFAGGDTVNLLAGVEFFLVHNHIVMDKEWASKNFDVAVRFTKAIKEAGEFVHKNPDEAGEGHRAIPQARRTAREGAPSEDQLHDGSGRHHDDLHEGGRRQPHRRRKDQGAVQLRRLRLSGRAEGNRPEPGLVQELAELTDNRSVARERLVRTWHGIDDGSVAATAGDHSGDPGCEPAAHAGTLPARSSLLSASMEGGGRRPLGNSRGRRPAQASTHAETGSDGGSGGLSPQLP